jgi:hypothetical protein
MNKISVAIVNISRFVANILTALTFLVCLTGVRAQSVEKAETSKQSREQESELDRARAIVTKPKDNKATKPETGGTWGPYSTTSSLELGYRFVDTDGNDRRYLSDVNVRDGFRVLESSLEMRAQPGTGLLFDFLRANVQNAGGDAQQDYSLRMEKARWYRLDSNVRRFNYYRAPDPTLALGWRDYDLRQQVSDVTLKLFPGRAVRVYGGYGRTMATGRYTPTYSFQRDVFQLYGDARWQANDFRAGVDATWKKWDFGFEAFYRTFRNDPEIVAQAGGDPGLAVTDPARINTLDRVLPQRSRAGIVRGSVRGNVNDRLHIVLRGVHDDEHMRAYYLEQATGRDNAGLNILSSTISLPNNGEVTRPATRVDFGLSYDINDHFTLNETLSYSAFKIQGNAEILTSTIRQLASGAQTNTVSRVLATNYITDLDSFWNTLDLGMNWGRKFTANVAWRVMNRDVKIGSNYLVATSPITAANPTITDESESVTTQAVSGGFRVRPTTKTSFMFDVEKGQNNNAFVRINPLDYTRIRARAQVQLADNIGITGTFTSLDRTNPTPQVNNDSDLRSYTVAVNWEPKSRVWLDAGYDYHDQYATADILYTTVINNVTTRVSGRSLYYARINSFYVNGRLGVTNRLDLLFTYYYLMDRGAPTVAVGPNDFVSSLPLRRHNPEGRLSYRFTDHVSGNISYRHYSYNETLMATQDYRANILTTSLRFAF